MQYRAGYALISVVVPTSADGAAAVRVLAQQLVLQIREVTRRDLGLAVSMVRMGPETLATIMTDGAILHGAQRSQIQAQLVSKPIPDHYISETAEAEMRDLHLSSVLASRVHGLDNEPATVSGTQQALTQARATMRFYTDPQSQPPPGYGPVADELPEPDGPRFKVKAGRDQLVIGTGVIERRRTGSRGVESAYDRADMQNLILVIDDPQDCVVFVDAEYPIVEVIFDTYRKESELRELIAQRTAGVPRIPARNAAYAEPARQRVRHTRKAVWGAILVPALIIGFAFFMSWLDDFRSVGEPAPEHTNPPEAEPEREPTAVELTVGDTATLPNWSRLIINSVTAVDPNQASEFPTDNGQHFTVEVQYCAAEEEDSVDPGQFRMLHGEPAQLAHDDQGLVEDPFEARELTIGQCATGNLGCFVLSDEPSNLKVDYRPGDLGSLTWAVEDGE